MSTAPHRGRKIRIRRKVSSTAQQAANADVPSCGLSIGVFSIRGFV